MIRTAIACALAAAMIAPAAAPAPARADAIVDVPVSFEVQNHNRTAIPCPTDGGTYRVSGTLVAPRALLEHPTHRPVALLVHGAAMPGSFIARYQGAPGFDIAAALAARGHATVVIDRLGFGDSDIPPLGLLDCAAAQADMAHQIVRALRDGTYEAPDDALTTFTRVALAGHSYGGFIVGIEAYSFGDIDALLVLSWAGDQGFELETGLGLARSYGATCARGGETKWSGDPAGGYAYSWTREDIPETFSFDTLDPAIRQPILDHWERDPCGLQWDPPHLIAGLELLGTITVPVLLVYGEVENDWREPQGRAHAAWYTGTTDRTIEIIPGASHLLWLGPEQVRATFLDTVSGWLDDRGF